MASHWKRLVWKHEHHTNNQTTFIQDDYQAPRTRGILSPNSKWLIVRNNLHKIRSWLPIRRLSVIRNPFVDWYVFFQMKRELKRAEEQIRAIQYRTNFTPIHYFNLPIDDTRFRRYNVSHVRSNDAIYYGGLSSQPIALENLLYYFNEECRVPYNSIFYSFLCDVNSVLHTNYQRIQRVTVFRHVALVATIAVFVILLTMLFSLVLSVFTTTTNLREFYRKT